MIFLKASCLTTDGLWDHRLGFWLLILVSSYEKGYNSIFLIGYFITIKWHDTYKAPIKMLGPRKILHIECLQ